MKYAVIANTANNQGLFEVLQVLHSKNKIINIAQIPFAVGFAIDQLIEADSEVARGYLYNPSTQSFVPRVASRQTLLTKHAFFARLTMPEKMLLIAPDNVGDMPNMPQLPIEATVMLKVFAKEIELAADIDLDHPALVGGLNQLEAMGLLQAGRADEIRGVAQGDG